MTRRATAEVRFWAKVDKSAGSEGCWPWTGRCDGKGYGKVYRDGRELIASRVVWKLVHQSIPDGLFVLHHCDNPPCVNPAHLFLGTQSDNMKDMVARGRAGPQMQRRKQSLDASAGRSTTVAVNPRAGAAGLERPADEPRGSFPVRAGS